MMANLPPAAILIFGALLVPLLRGRTKTLFLLALPVLSFVHLLGLERGLHWQFELFGHPLILARIDQLSLLWGYIFHLVTFLGVIYAIRVRDDVQHVTSLIYAGGAIGGAFAGDLITLFAFMELTAVSSVFLIWSRRTERAYKAGLRYVLVQIGSGMLMLAGLLIRLHETGSIAFDGLGLNGLGSQLIFVAFGIKCAFPFLHNWLQDAYPEATVTGTVFLSAFTTKLAVYALIRGFAGAELLIWIGVAMALFPIFYAVIENDLRRALAYSLNNQLGFMVVGVGIGTELAINGAAAHAFASILYQALLFMAVGAVLHRTGTIKASELGGVYKSMPITTVFCLIGAASISAFPLFSGFVTKSLTMAATAEQGLVWPWLGLLFASAGVMNHSGIRIPYCGFFGKDAGIRCQEAPANMLVAMGLTAALCLGIGIFPHALYAILPYPVDFEPYTSSHVVTQLQLLLGALLAFAVLEFRRLEIPNLPSANLDSDWLYRRLLPNVAQATLHGADRARSSLNNWAAHMPAALLAALSSNRLARSLRTRSQLTGSSVQMVLVLLSAYLLYFIVRNLLTPR